MGSNRPHMTPGGLWVGNEAGWPTPPRLPPSSADIHLKNGLFRLFYTVFSTYWISTSDQLHAPKSLDMLAYMKNHLQADPSDVSTPSCDPHSSPLAILHSGPILASMNISGFLMKFKPNLGPKKNGRFLSHFGSLGTLATQVF